MSTLLDYLSQNALYEHNVSETEELEISDIPHVSKTLITGMFVRNYTSHCQKFFDNFMIQAGDKLPRSQINELKRIFANVFDSIEQIGKNDKTARFVPAETKKLAVELFTNQIEPSKDQKALKLGHLMDQLSVIDSVWTAEEVKDLQRRNMLGE